MGKTGSQGRWACREALLASDGKLEQKQQPHRGDLAARVWLLGAIKSWSALAVHRIVPIFAMPTQLAYAASQCKNKWRFGAGVNIDWSKNRTPRFNDVSIFHWLCRDRFNAISLENRVCFVAVLFDADKDRFEEESFDWSFPCLKARTTLTIIFFWIGHRDSSMNSFWLTNSDCHRGSYWPSPIFDRLKTFFAWRMGNCSSQANL